jgi:hypothetical protein
MCGDDADLTSTDISGADRMSADVHGTHKLEKVPAYDEHDHVGLLRRGFDRIRANGNGHAIPDSLDDSESLRLEVMLLREEVARLRTDRHRPPDVGSLIDQLRQLTAENGEADMEDEVWSGVADMMVIREGLEQACIELESAVGAVRRRLRGLSLKLDQNGLAPEAPEASLITPLPDLPNASTPDAWHRVRDPYASP